MVTGLRIVGLPEAQSKLLASALREHGFEVAGDGHGAPGGPALEPANLLTPRHLEILSAVRRHGSAAEAAEALGISLRTVNAHLDAIYQRLGVHRRMNAVCWACRRGLLDAPGE